MGHCFNTWKHLKRSCVFKKIDVAHPQLSDMWSWLLEAKVRKVLVANTTVINSHIDLVPSDHTRCFQFLEEKCLFILITSYVMLGTRICSSAVTQILSHFLWLFFAYSQVFSGYLRAAVIWGVTLMEWYFHMARQFSKLRVLCMKQCYFCAHIVVQFRSPW